VPAVASVRLRLLLRAPPVLLLALASASVAWPRPARAGGPLGPDGSPIRTSRYAIDFYSGPVVSSERVIGLAGSFSAIAEGVDAVPINPAAAAVREPWSNDWFDYDLTVGLALPAAFWRSDVENLGARSEDYRYDGYYVPSVGLVGRFGHTGLGLTLDDRRYTLSLTGSPGQATPQRFAASLYSLHAVLARAAWRGQVTVGVGLRLVGFSLSDESTKKTRLSLTGASAETGVLVAPTDHRFRIGLVGRLPVAATPIADSEIQPDAQGDIIGPGHFYLPRSVEVPWEAELSVAVELGERPFNPYWENPDEYSRPLRAEISRARSLRQLQRVSPADEEDLRQEEEERLAEHEADLRVRRDYAHRRMSRVRKLLTATVLVTGPVADAVAPVSLLQQTVTRSGESVSVTARLGLEMEPIPDWLQMRLGTYLEPGRAAQSSARLHFTLGFDGKVFPWTVFGAYADDTWWSIGAVLDVADRYMNLAFRAGVWR